MHDVLWVTIVGTTRRNADKHMAGALRYAPQTAQGPAREAGGGGGWRLAMGVERWEEEDVETRRQREAVAT